MKKIVLVLLILVVVSGTAFSFDILSFPGPLRGGGAVMLDAGIGVLYTPWSIVGALIGKVRIPPLFLNIEYALPVGVPISVGGGVAFGQWTFYDYRLAQITPYTNVNWHWGFDASWLDLYTGLTIGYNIVALQWRPDYTGTRTSVWGSNTFHWGTHVGVHFYFAKVFGVMVEAGYPFFIKAALSFKFGGRGSGSDRNSSGSKSSTVTATVTSNVNFRSGPSTNNTVIRQLPQGTVVTLTGATSGDWTQVIHNGDTGWISSEFLKR